MAMSGAIRIQPPCVCTSFLRSYKSKLTTFAQPTKYPSRRKLPKIRSDSHDFMVHFLARCYEITGCTRQIATVTLVKLKGSVGLPAAAGVLHGIKLVQNKASDSLQQNKDSLRRLRILSLINFVNPSILHPSLFYMVTPLTIGRNQYHNIS